MSIINSVKTRRTIKLFNETPLSEEKVISWLKAANYAPNHRMTKPWDIVFFGVSYPAGISATKPRTAIAEKISYLT